MASFDYQTDLSYVYRNVGSSNYRVDDPNLSTWQDVTVFIPTVISDTYISNILLCDIRERLTKRRLLIKVTDNNQYSIDIPFNSNDSRWSLLISQVLADSRIISAQIIGEIINPYYTRLLTFTP